MPPVRISRSAEARLGRLSESTIPGRAHFEPIEDDPEDGATDETFTFTTVDDEHE